MRHGVRRVLTFPGTKTCFAVPEITTAPLGGSPQQRRTLLVQGIPLCQVAEKYKIHRNSLAKYLKF